MTFAQGISVPEGQSLSYRLFNTSGTYDEITLFADGYSVPSASVPAAARVIGRSASRNQ
jgi:hypothetical protein